MHNNMKLAAQHFTTSS